MIYNLNKLEDLRKAEKHKTQIENKGLKPKIRTVGFNKMEIF